MILVITSSDDATADYLLERLRARRLAVVRLDTDVALLNRISIDYSNGKPTLNVLGRRLSPEEITHVWFRRPRPLLAATSPEEAHLAAEWSEALEGFLAHIPIAKWVNHPSRNALAGHKMEQLTRARGMGFEVPATLVTTSPDELRTFWTECNRRVVVKPLSYGFIERSSPEADTVIYTSELTQEHVDAAASLAACPTLFQRMIEKQADVRVTVVDQFLTFCALRKRDPTGKQELDIRRDNMVGVEYALVDPPDAVRAQLVSLVDSYQLRFAAIDMAIDSRGKWIFFEVNPNGQWAWQDLAGATNIASDFAASFSTEGTGKSS